MKGLREPEFFSLSRRIGSHTACKSPRERWRPWTQQQPIDGGGRWCVSAMRHACMFFCMRLHVRAPPYHQQVHLLSLTSYSPQVAKEEKTYDPKVMKTKTMKASVAESDVLLNTMGLAEEVNKFQALTTQRGPPKFGGTGSFVRHSQQLGASLLGPDGGEQGAHA
jgi:hypothetical protein